MSRYIEYHDICSAIGNQQDGTGMTYEALAHAMVEIQLAPSIDIVRCKECKWLRYCETEDLDLYLDCDKPDGGGIPRSEEWFCADGEREGE